MNNLFPHAALNKLVDHLLIVDGKKGLVLEEFFDMQQPMEGQRVACRLIRVVYPLQVLQRLLQVCGREIAL